MLGVALLLPGESAERDSLMPNELGLFKLSESGEAQVEPSGLEDLFENVPKLRVPP